MKKVIISPGYGAGWSSWATNGKFCAEHYALIEAIEKMTDEDRKNIVKLGEYEEIPKCLIEAWQIFKRDWEEQFGDEGLPYSGGLYQAEVVTVDGRYHISEYDGYESLDLPNDMDWW